MLTFSTLSRVAIVGAALLVPFTAAHAGGRKEQYVQDYNFKTPMHGVSGHTGAYYCDYQRLPKQQVTVTKNGEVRTKVVGWTLRQTCY